MNSGIQDAVDLSWKLEAVVRGWGGAELLQSYQIERRPVALRNVAASTANLARMLATRTRRPPPEMFEPGPAGDAARKEYGAWYTDEMRHEWFMNGYHLGYRYDDSPIIVPDGTRAPPLGTSTYIQTARPGRGRRMSGSPMAARRSIFWARLRAASPRRRCVGGEGLQHAAAERGVPLRIVALDAPAVFNAYQRRLCAGAPRWPCGLAG
jgi:hypothetical protein